MITTQGAFADGILAQSVGGGGGNGGFAVESLASPGSSFGYDLGGSGGAGNNAGTVTVANFSSIGTFGASAVGLEAQSVGGGGGSGGFKVSVSVSDDAKGFGTSDMFGFGNGGGGGDADTVTVGNTAMIATTGINSDGIIAQSIGGGGGYGGFSYLTQLLGDLGVGLGSTTDGGGTASDVNVINTAAIGTLGDNADDILAQSIGGGGGKGGFGISGGFNTNPTSSVSGINLGLGSNGGAGGSAGNVTVTNRALLVTSGNNANGIVAESIGGGGGDGGFAVAADMTASKYGIGLSLGGAGGSAGNAGNVTINNTGSIITHGQNSDDIIAESLGGGGGDGGFAVNVLSSEGLSGNVAIGASGGSGGNSGNVTINSSGGVLETTGLDSTAIVAQSVAGGGGSGGIGVAGFAIAGVPLLGLSVGGNDGAGGTSGTVTINNTSEIETTGDFSSVTFSQSVGAGGGVGTTDVADATNSTLTGPVSVGANGGFGGDGLAANVGNSALLITKGLGSNAFYGESVGGGGGFAGFEVSHNLSVASGPGGLTFGANSTMTCLPTVTGVIGCNSSAGDGSAVVATNSHEIDTTGDASSAIFAQSIGAGGGAGVFSVGGTYTGSALEIVEGANTSFGNGGTIAVSNAAHAPLTTFGLHSDGIAAQSIGSGGGYGTVEVAQGVLGGTTLAYTLGATTDTVSAFTGGNGGNVGVANASAIVTHGDFSSGILEQSIGDGGGDGAIQIGGTVATGGLGLVLQFGGSNLTGGNGGAIALTNTGTIGIVGNDAFGILAQTIGGGGGSGGFSGTISDTLGTPSIAGYAIGGTNVANTFGGPIVASNSGAITTMGSGDAGLVAQTIAGGGGESGYGLNLALGTSGPTLLLLLDGSGGSNNVSGNLTLTNSAPIGTAGANAPDAIAQSIAGGGGNGGFSATGNLTTSTGSIPQLDVAVGGSGGFGNIAGGIAYTGTTPLITQGDGSAALVTQSIGQGGGNAELTFNGAFSSGLPNAPSVDVGGTGFGGGSGGDITIANTGAIATGLTHLGTTTGAFSDGILAQSVGGGGGNGVLTMGLGKPTGTAALGTVNVKVGGSGPRPGALGGSTGSGGAITLSDTGAIQTLGAYADGIAAQSIGDGGGIGAADIFGTSLIASTVKPSKYDLNINVGGGGGIANAGGTVSVTHAGGTIATFGNDANDILAQSVGGGGGAGGSLRSILENSSQCSTSSSTCSTQLVGTNVTVGGSGGGQSNSGANVSVTNTGALTTTGTDASAIVAQSIGGGGGIAGDAHGIGNVLVNWGDAVGGSNGSAGDGGNVSVSDTGAIITTGNGSSAIVAQSVGGGGGIGGLGLSAGVTGTLSLGGTTGANGNGGNVNVAATNTGTNMIETTGNDAFGIFAQSVGGGGGVAGNIDGGVSKSIIGSGSSLTSTGGGGGSGGAVTVSNTGNIETLGTGSDGIFAQSVGGGGGITTGYAGSAGSPGNGGVVSVTQKGILATSGNGADAIFAQSAGGASGTGGNVTVNVTGDALAYGNNADGILAQSLGGAGNGNIGITINTGSYVQGGTGSGSVGVRVLGGASNTLLNDGTITTASSPHAVHYPFDVYRYGTAAGIESTQLATSGNYQVTSLMTNNAALESAFVESNMANQKGTAIYANAGTLTLTNNGNIYGSIVLDGATLVFANNGTYVPGSQMNFGEDGMLMLTSGSVMTPGGGGYVATSNLVGNLDEMAGSNYLVTLDLTNHMSSSINLSGTASVAGNIDLDLLNTNDAVPGAHSESIITAGGGVTNNGLLVAPPKSAVATFTLSYLPNDVLLNYDVNYAPATGGVLNVDDLAFGNYLGQIQTAGSSPKLASMMSTVLAIPTVTALKGFYDRFAPSATLDLGSSALLSNLQFSSAMLACHDDAHLSQSGDCDWGTSGSSQTTQDATFSSGGYAQSGMNFATGFEHRIGNGATSIGAAVHYASGSLSDDSGMSLTGGNLEGGISATRITRSGVALSADLLGGAGRYDTVRQIGYPSPATQATGIQDLSFIGAHLRADKYFGNSVNGITPFVDLGLTHVYTGELNENGAGQFNETIAAHREFLPTVASGVRFERWMQRKSYALHAALDLSATQLIGNPTSFATATLSGAPAGVAPFMLYNTMDRTYFSLIPSLQFTNNSKFSVRLIGTYNFSATSRSLGTNLQVSTRL